MNTIWQASELLNALQQEKEALVQGPNSVLEWLDSYLRLSEKERMELIGLLYKRRQHTQALLETFAGR